MKRNFFCIVLFSCFALTGAWISVPISSQSGRIWSNSNSRLANANRPAFNAPGNSDSRSSYKYYLEIDRPSAGYLSPEIWRQIGTTVQKAGIPMMFGTRDILDYGEDWMPASITRTSVDEGVLILGPFVSSSKAIATLNRLPKILPQKYDESFAGVQKGPTETPQTWQIGLFQIWGFKSNLPISSKKRTVARESGIMDAAVIEFSEGASGSSLIVEYNGVEYGFCLYGNCGAPEKVIGNVTDPGSMVRIWYKSIRPNDDGSFSLDVTKVQLIKKR